MSTRVIGASRLSTRVVGASLLACCLPAAILAQEAGPIPRQVRSSTRWGLELIAEGCRRSPSFHGLVDGLRETDVVVYVEPAQRLPGVTVAVTELVGKSGPARYLRISIGVQAVRKRLIAVLGHELQHALEIGRTQEVVDQETLEAFYRRTGDASVDGYDSRAARDVGDIIYAELWRRAQPAASSDLGQPAEARPTIYPELTRR